MFVMYFLAPDPPSYITQRKKGIFSTHKQNVFSSSGNNQQKVGRISWLMGGGNKGPGGNRNVGGGRTLAVGLTKCMHTFRLIDSANEKLCSIMQYRTITQNVQLFKPLLLVKDDRSRLTLLSLVSSPRRRLPLQVDENPNGMLQFEVKALQNEKREREACEIFFRPCFSNK